MILQQYDTPAVRHSSSTTLQQYDTPGALVMEFKEWFILLFNQEMRVSTLFGESCEDINR